MVALWHLISLSILTSCSRAYIPASATNDTSEIVFDDSSLSLRWTNRGNYGEQISRQLIKEGGSLGINKGALVHFVENATIPAAVDQTITPWIAFVSCDKNSSDASQDDDIFTMARDRGAVAALLYSTTSTSCSLNAWYRDPYEFDQVFDIYTTITRSSARLIESQFSLVSKNNYWFDSTRLNSSFEDVSNAVAGEGVDPGYLIATVKIANVTDPTDGMPPDGNGNHDNNNNDDDDDDDDSTGLAMIILYAITGCVSALFCIVIISGAVRAIRHPERYGPRVGDPNVLGPGGEAQTRTAGITRAILDTFPVVKFGRSSSPNDHGDQKSMKTNHYAQDEGEAMEMGAQASGAQQLSVPTTPRNNSTTSIQQAVLEGTSSDIKPRTSSDANAVPGGPLSSASHHAATSSSHAPAVDPESIGHATCPICILDFEEGDDLRVLPCDGKHTFHRDCVDPWLLELSTSCPLCREDFQALENMSLGQAPGNTDEPIMEQGSHHGVFSKYVRAAQRRRSRASRIPRHSVHPEGPDGSHQSNPR